MVDYSKANRIKNLTIKDNIIFGSVMLEEDICRELLEIILDIKIARIEYFEKERVIENSIVGKSVRLDVYVADDKGTIYDIEMQVRSLKNDDLLKRARYYSANIDVDNLRKGNAYVKLPDTFVIFICLFDPFGEGRHIYTFKRSCLQSSKINDGTTLIFLNAKGVEDDVSPRLKAFLNYVIGINSDDPFVCTLDEAVEKNKIYDWRMEKYISIQEGMENSFNDGKEEGLAQGIEEGRAQGVEEGRAQGMAEAVRRFVSSGMGVEEVARLLGCSLRELEVML